MGLLGDWDLPVGSHCRPDIVHPSWASLVTGCSKSSLVHMDITPSEKAKANGLSSSYQAICDADTEIWIYTHGDHTIGESYRKRFVLIIPGNLWHRHWNMDIYTWRSHHWRQLWQTVCPHRTRQSVTQTLKYGYIHMEITSMEKATANGLSSSYQAICDTDTEIWIYTHGYHTIGESYGEWFVLIIPGNLWHTEIWIYTHGDHTIGESYGKRFVLIVPGNLWHRHWNMDIYTWRSDHWRKLLRTVCPHRTRQSVTQTLKYGYIHMEITPLEKATANGLSSSYQAICDTDTEIWIYTHGDHTIGESYGERFVLIVPGNLWHWHWNMDIYTWISHHWRKLWQTVCPHRTRQSVTQTLKYGYIHMEITPLEKAMANGLSSSYQAICDTDTEIWIYTHGDHTIGESYGKRFVLIVPGNLWHRHWNMDIYTWRSHQWRKLRRTVCPHRTRQSVTLTLKYGYIHMEITSMEKATANGLSSSYQAICDTDTEIWIYTHGYHTIGESYGERFVLIIICDTDTEIWIYTHGDHTIGESYGKRFVLIVPGNLWHRHWNMDIYTWRSHHWRKLRRTVCPHRTRQSVTLTLKYGYIHMDITPLEKATANGLSSSYQAICDTDTEICQA